MPQNGEFFSCLILIGVLYGLSKRHPDAPVVRFARRYGWLVSMGALIFFLTQLHWPIGIVGELVLLALLVINGQIIWACWQSRK